MARKAGKVAVFKIEDAGSTVRDISDRVNSAAMSRNADQVDITGLNVNYRDSIGGLQGWSMDVRGIWDDAANNVDAIFKRLVGRTTGASVLLSGSTGLSYAGSVVVTSYGSEAAVDGAVMFSATFAGTGQYRRQ